MAENARASSRGTPAGQRVTSNGFDIKSDCVDVGFELGMARRTEYGPKWRSVPDWEVGLVVTVVGVVPEETTVLDTYRSLGTSNSISDTSLRATDEVS